MNNYESNLTYKSNGEDSCLIYDKEILIAEIRGLYLLNTKFRPFGEIIIGEEYPLPLFWRQYANNEDPERSASELLSRNIYSCDGSIIIEIQSQNSTGAIVSNFRLSIIYNHAEGAYLYRFNASLIVKSEWIITYNPTHGEVEYLNFYPLGAFTKTKGAVKKYNSFLYEGVDGFVVLPHLHFDLKSYSNIKLKKEGRFLYVGERELPTIKLMNNTNENTDIGICAYMWDSHFGYRVCDELNHTRIINNTKFEADFELSTITIEESKILIDNALPFNCSEVEDVPFLHEGVNSFNKSIFDFHNPTKYWQFQHEIVSDGKADSNVGFFIDRSDGYSDNNSLAITAPEHITARWIYTSFGPEFGGDKLPNKPIKISCYVKIYKSDEGSFAQIKLRFRKNDSAKQEFVYFASENITIQNEWTKIELVTPETNFRYDRLHLLLEFCGKGECRFDDLEVVME